MNGRRLQRCLQRPRRQCVALFLIFAAAHGVWAAGAAGAATSIAREYAQAEQAFRDGDLALAERLYSKILEVHGDEPSAWFRIGLMQQRRQSFKAALNAYDSALACAQGETSDAVNEVLAKVRYNRALLLMESAERDLKGIAPGTLNQELDATREALSAHLDAALSAAGTQVSDAPDAAPAGPASADQASAKGYVYEVRTRVATADPIEDKHP